MCGAANEDWLKVSESLFLTAHAECWTAKQAPEFSVVNVHAIEIPAPAARIFPELGSRDLLVPRAYGRFLVGLRAVIGKIFDWDSGLSDPKPQAIEPGQYFAFFHVLHVDAPREVGMAFENRLTRALMSWVLRESSNGTTVFNVTCANFKGRLYWQVIGPFHDGLIEDSLRELGRRFEAAERAR
jgi:hypothetical protein